MNCRILNTKYALIQGIYYIILCVLMSYGALYLGKVGLRTGFIGIVIASANILATLAQPMIARYIDQHHTPLASILLGMAMLCGVLSVVMFVIGQLPYLVAIIFALLSAMAITMMPFINALTFVFEEKGVVLNFGLSRGIGSVAYALMSLILGYIVSRISPIYLPFVITISSLGLLPILRGFRNDHVGYHQDTVKTSSFSFLQHYKLFFLMLVGYILIYIDHQLINTYMIYIVRDIGGNSVSMGIATFIAAFLELPGMVLFQKYKDKLNISYVMIFAGIMYSIKHLLTLFAPNMTIFFIAQMLQIFAFALFIPASVFYIDSFFDKKDATTGQALFTMSATIAGVIASVAGGLLIEVTNVHITLFIFAVLSVVGSAILVSSIKCMK
ncbi:MAG TPA: MFS transporter [Erysipelotrichaceae bacterium]|nr:MFS transporter [Erysipelotrichaceae bacterium]